MPTLSVLKGNHRCTVACTKGWPPGNRCHCTICGNNFSTPALFDRHRKNGACLDPSRMRDVHQDERGVYRNDYAPKLEISDRFYPR